MRKLAICRCAALFFSISTFFAATGFCQSAGAGQAPAPQAAEARSDSGWWDLAVGKPARDALLLGMWTLHLDGTGEYFGDGRNNDQAHLIGLQVAGFTAGTYINSHDDRTFYGGLAREVYSTELGGGLRLDLGYKFGLLYGYGDDLFNLFGITPFAVGTCGLTWNRIGVDFGIIPVGILTLNFRIDIDDLTRLLH
jgi:hypothetical protein